MKLKSEFLRELDRLVIAPVVEAFTKYQAEATEATPPHPRNVRVLLLATALAETGGRELQQGPTDEPTDALSFWQIEPATHLDIYRNFLQVRPVLRGVIRETSGMLIYPGDVAASPRLVDLFQRSNGLPGDSGGCPPHWFLSANPRYACFMSRITYLRAPDEIPEFEGDIEPFAEIWKEVYNTPGGRGTIEHFCEAWTASVTP